MLLVARGIGDSLFSFSMKGIIYIATNLFNGRSYVGQTVTSLSRRKEKHFSDAVTDSVNHFHLALMQYGKNAFEWKVLDEFSGTKEEVIHALNVAEEYHILRHRTMLDEYGYNATKGGYSSDKFADVIKKRALANYGGKAVLQYDLEGNFVREFESIAEVKRVMNAMGHKGTRFVGRMWRGYQWREKMNEYFPRKIDAYSTPKPLGKGVVVYTIDGKFYKAYSKQIDCWKDLGRKHQIRDGFEGVKIQSHLNAKYLVFRDNGDYPQEVKVNIVYPIEQKGDYDNRIPVLQYSRDGKFIAEYASIAEAHRKSGMATGAIRASCQVSLPFQVGPCTKFIWRRGGGVKVASIEVMQKARGNNESKGYVHKMEHRVIQYDNNGELIKVWNNMLQASLNTGESLNLIRKQCMGLPTKKKTPSIWKYYKNEALAV